MSIAASPFRVESNRKEDRLMERFFFFFLEIENFFFESKGSFITIDRRMELKNLWRIYSIINQRPIQGFCIGSLKEAIWKDSMNGTSMKNINIEWKKRKKVK